MERLSRLLVVFILSLTFSSSVNASESGSFQKEHYQGSTNLPNAVAFMVFFNTSITWRSKALSPGIPIYLSASA